MCLGTLSLPLTLSAAAAQNFAPKYARQVQQGMRRPDGTIAWAGEVGRRVQLATNYGSSLKLYCTFPAYLSAFVPVDCLLECLLKNGLEF